MLTCLCNLFIFSFKTTVCGKPMVLTESVRDAGDLWLSLKYPPTLFMCDTPCTLTHHVLNRLSGVAQKYFGVTHGCFEKPMIGKMPTRVCSFGLLLFIHSSNLSDSYLFGTSSFRHYSYFLKLIPLSFDAITLNITQQLLIL